MIKLMIVDDDFLVRSNIKLMLSELNNRNDNYQVEVIAEAGDGSEAYCILKSVQPDIIISDIQMPKMDGIELQNYVNASLPEVQFIMLSNYDDYNYVREALRNGAVDYILKHKLSVDILDTAIKRANDMSHKNYNQELSKELIKGNSLTALKRDFILSLIAGFHIPLEEIKSRITILGLPLALNNLVTIIMTVQCDSNQEQEPYLLQNSIVNIMDEILQDTHSGICCHVTDDKYIILLSYASVYSENIRRERNYEVINRISLCISKFLDMKAKFYQGNIVFNIMDIKKSYLTAEQKYRNRYYDGMEKHDLAMDKPFDSMAVFGLECEHSLMSYIRSNNKKATMDIIVNVFEELCKWSPSLKDSQIVFIDLLSVFNRICKEKNIDINRIYTNQMTPQEKFNEFTSILDAKVWFIELYESILQEEGKVSQLPHSEYVSEAISYIRTYYAENISQTMVADKIGISPVYLSKLFKDDLQVGFMDYLINYRLEKAKYLLSQKDFSNKKVALLCGFNDDAYFSKVFKKVVGMTPKEYRKSKISLK